MSPCTPRPTYKNSAADALFQRNSLLFGLDCAAATIRRSGEALLVEGPLDVIQLHQGGIEQAVAALGTSLSPTQRQLLERSGARRLVIAMDGDGPGVQATARLLTELRPLAISGELEQLLAPALAAPEDLALLQRCDRKASQLLALLPPGGLRQRAEQRLR